MTARKCPSWRTCAPFDHHRLAPFYMRHEWWLQYVDEYEQWRGWEGYVGPSDY